MSDGIGGIIAGIIEGVSSTGLSIYDRYISDQRHKEKLKREDTGHQRAVKDLIAAGVSPTLAAGQPLQASQPTAPPEMKLSVMERAMQGMTMENLIDQNRMINESANAVKSRGAMDQLKADTMYHDLRILKGLPEPGVLSTADPYSKLIATALSNLQKDLKSAEPMKALGLEDSLLDPEARKELQQKRTEKKIKKKNAKQAKRNRKGEIDALEKSAKDRSFSVKEKAGRAIKKRLPKRR